MKNFLHTLTVLSTFTHPYTSLPLHTAIPSLLPHSQLFLPHTRTAPSPLTRSPFLLLSHMHILTYLPFRRTYSHLLLPSQHSRRSFSFHTLTASPPFTAPSPSPTRFSVQRVTALSPFTPVTTTLHFTHSQHLSLHTGTQIYTLHTSSPHITCQYSQFFSSYTHPLSFTHS